METRAGVILFTKNDLNQMVPHRGTALCIDQAMYEPGKPEQITSFIFLNPENPYFDGHFPGKAMLPGHWQLEMMALSAAVLMKHRFPEIKGTPVIGSFGSRQKFMIAIKPLQQIEIIVSIKKKKEMRGYTFIQLNGEIILADGRIATKAFNLLGSMLPEK